jgi:phosphoribosylformylglycinamidine cyclo-ligase
MPKNPSPAPAPQLSDYAAAGVDMDVKYRAVELMTAAVKSTYTPEVLAGIGAFGGLFDAGGILRELRAPVLVGSTDGVGTKVKLAAKAGRYGPLGEDIVNHCVNDILVQGARPLFFLDYFASSKLRPEIIAEVVGGMAKACREAGCALIGGETAEMPGVYQPGEFDVAGTIVGVVDRERILPKPGLRPGDVLIGIRSSGPHTNGYSLIRKIFENTPLDTILPELGLPLVDALLAPHRSYLPVLKPLLAAEGSPIKALAHLTGGGWIENPIRVFPEGIGAEVKLGSWPVPPLFSVIQRQGEVNPAEMHRVFNMGIGMLLIVSPADAERVRGAIPEETWIVGRLIEGQRQVILR